MLGAERPQRSSEAIEHLECVHVEVWSIVSNVIKPGTLGSCIAFFLKIVTVIFVFLYNCLLFCHLLWLLFLCLSLGCTFLLRFIIYTLSLHDALPI